MEAPQRPSKHKTPQQHSTASQAKTRRDEGAPAEEAQDRGRQSSNKLPRRVPAALLRDMI